MLWFLKSTTKRTRFSSVNLTTTYVAFGTVTIPAIYPQRIQYTSEDAAIYGYAILVLVKKGYATKERGNDCKLNVVYL